LYDLDKANEFAVCNGITKGEGNMCTCGCVVIFVSCLSHFLNTAVADAML
jgi:hypothetical protein